MKRSLIVLCATLSALPLAACSEGYGYGGGIYAGGPYAYDGFYDDYYGPIYDGYWGTDGIFYYRSGAHDRHFHRGDNRHFMRQGAAGSNFHQFHGAMTPEQGTRMPHFNGTGENTDRAHRRH